MATVLSQPILLDRPHQGTGLTLVEPAAEAGAQPRRHWRHLVTIEPASFLGREGARVFRAANYYLRAVRSWQHAVEWVERGELDAVLLDLDAIDAAVSPQNISSLRLVTLLRRAAEGKRLIIGAVSRRDFVEVEDVVRAGVTVFAPSAASPVTLIQRIEAARARTALKLVEVNA